MDGVELFALDCRFGYLGLVIALGDEQIGEVPRAESEDWLHIA